MRIVKSGKALYSGSVISVSLYYDVGRICFYGNFGIFISRLVNVHKRVDSVQYLC